MWQPHSTWMRICSFDHLWDSCWISEYTPTEMGEKSDIVTLSDKVLLNVAKKIWFKWSSVLLLLLSHSSRVWLCSTAAHQAPPSLGFSRQEHWSGLPFPSPLHESEKWSRSVVSDSQRPHGLQPTRLPPSLGFSRQEHWSGLPLPSPMHESEKWSRSVVSDSLRPHGL